MFRVPTDIKAGKAITINGQAYAKGDRIEADDLATIAGRLHVYMSKGLLYTSPDQHGRKTKAGNRQPGFLPPVILNATLSQEVVQDAPAAPTAVSAAYDTTTTVTVSFTPGAAGVKPITNYEYKVGTGAWTALDPVDTSSPVTVPVAANASGSLRIRAVSLIGKGTQSDAAAYSTLLPAAPTALVPTVGETTVSMAFTPGAAGAQAISDYEYQLDGGAWVSAATATSPVAISGLTKGTEYSIKLRAISAVGNGAASAASVVTTDSEPAAPTALVATPGDTTASIAFTPGADNGSAITDYEYRVDAGAWTTGATTASPVVVTGLVNDVEVSITIRAVNAVGNGAASAPVLVTPTAA